MSQDIKIANAAQELGRKGGLARANSMTKDDQKALMALAREARHNKKYQKATHSGIIKIGEKEIRCAVLEDGTRVINQTSMYKALGRKGNPRKSDKNDHPSQVPSFLDYKGLKPFIDKDITSPLSPIQFRMPNGGLALGFKATLLPEICEVYLKAKDAGVLPSNQAHIATQCEIIIRSLAKVGIISLVDEASGYQEEREKNALQVLLSKYISEDLLPWTKRFPDEFFKQLKRIGNCEYITKGSPSWFGHFINDYVYNSLSPEILKEMKKRNPINESGNRLSRHHQWLTSTGISSLDKQLTKVLTVMQLSESKEQFEELYKKLKPIDFPKEKEIKNSEEIIPENIP